jgi:hypothetical protein
LNIKQPTRRTSTCAGGEESQTRPRESLNQGNVEQAQSAQQALINESNLDADSVDEKSLIGGNSHRASRA